MDPIIKFKVQNQSITRIDGFHVFSSSRRYLYAEFAFLTDDWNGVSKTAIFEYKGGVKQVLLEGDRCMVPWEALSNPGILKVSVFGGNLITVGKSFVQVSESGFNGDDLPEPPTPDLYAQLLEMTNEKIVEMDETIGRAKTATSSALEAAEQASKEAGNASDAAEEANRAAEKASDSATQAENAADAANKAAGSANDAASSVEEVKNAAANAAEKANTSAIRADAAADASSEAAKKANAGASRAETAADAAEHIAKNAGIATDLANAAANTAGSAAERADASASHAEEASLRATIAAERAEAIVEEAGKVVTRYGVRFDGSANSGETVRRLYNAVGLVAGVGTDTETAVNDFDHIYPWSHIRRCCGYWGDDGNFVVNAYKGDPGYAVDGSNGEVWVEIPLFYYKHIYDGDAEEIVISAMKLPGYMPSPINLYQGTEDAPAAKAYFPAYPMALVDGKPTSRSGVFSNLYSLNTAIADARKAGANYTVTTTAERYTLCLLMWVEFATRHLQSVMAGATNLPYAAADTAVITEPSANRIVVPNAVAAKFVVGQTVGIGTSAGNTSVADNRVVTSIDVYDAEHKAICFDGEAVDIAVGNVVFSLAWKNGSCDGVLSSSGSPVSNTNGKYNCVYREIERPYGDSFEQISDVLFKREGTGTAGYPYTYDVYFLPDPTKYANGAITDDYVKLHFALPTADGYVKKLGVDDRFPWVRIPCESGAAAATWYADSYYYPRGALCAARVGGYWTDGSKSGPMYWNCGNAPSYSVVNAGARLSYCRK